MMKTIKPLGNKVIGHMVDSYGERTTTGGLIVQEDNGSADSIRPRWFEVTHVGPEQNDVSVGDHVLVAHGRWSRGFSLNGSMLSDDQLFHLDTEEMLMVSPDPIQV